ncbi:MAG TPA: NADH-quinone oxidoreductase subunit L, partial [Armatimonadota bacterium]
MPTEHAAATLILPTLASPARELIWLIPLLPFLGALVNGLLGTRLPRSVSGWLGVLTVAASFALAIFLVSGGHAGESKLYEWLPLGDFQVPMALRLDALSSLMILVVTGVGFLIHVYSLGYMAHDERFPRFFTYLNLFVGSMLVLVLGN